jgi:lysophospholipase L1-like esterase
VIWLEGINDFSKNGNASVETVQAAMQEGAARLRARLPHVKVIGATLTPALGSTNAAHGSPEQDEKRKALNTFIRSSGVFDSVIEFDGAVSDPATGQLKPEFVHNTTTGGDGDKLHPNRLGYVAMGTAIDIAQFKPPTTKPTPKPTRK